MKLVYVLPLVVFSIFMVGYTFEHANAAIGSNTALILEASGFAVSENSIQTSQIDFAISTGDVASGKANIVVEDGFITLEDQDFIAMGISGQSLRDGKYLRLSGDAMDSFGEQTSFRVFGRLIEETDQGFVYSFTGKLVQGDQIYKLVYTSKIGGLGALPSAIPTTGIDTTIDEESFLPAGQEASSGTVDPSRLTTRPQDPNRLDQQRLTTGAERFPDSQPTGVDTGAGKVYEIQIMPGSANRGFDTNYVEGKAAAGGDFKSVQGQQQFRARYFSFDRVSISPGDTLVFINADSAPHTIKSGNEIYGKRASLTATVNPVDKYVPDGRVDTGEIPPGETGSITFTEAGFYRLYDPNAQWMNMIVYNFPDVAGSEVIRMGFNCCN